VQKKREGKEEKKEKRRKKMKALSSLALPSNRGAIGLVLAVIVVVFIGQLSYESSIRVLQKEIAFIEAKLDRLERINSKVVGALVESNAAGTGGKGNALAALKIPDPIKKPASEFEMVALKLRSQPRPKIDRTSPGRSNDLFFRLPVTSFPSSLVMKMKAEDPTDLGVKTFVMPSTYLEGKKGILYGVGIANDISFEATMAKSGLDAFAFDCTSPSNMAVVAKNRGVAFYPYCVGAPGKLGKGYLERHGRVGDKKIFKSLREIAEELKHSEVDILKFDIEGYEWGLLENEVLGAGGFLPKQLMFELHLQGAWAGAVPPAVVHGKTEDAMLDLFEKLFEAGYHVVAKEINPGDKRCCEFTLLRL
jgi:hypothetical protein